MICFNLAVREKIAIIVRKISVEMLKSAVAFQVFCLLQIWLQAKISLPSTGNLTYVSVGSNVNLSWSYNFGGAAIVTKTWYFTNKTGGTLELLGDIISGKLTKEKSSLSDITIISPSTLILNNVNIGYNGTYIFVVSLRRVKDPIMSEVVVIILEKPTAIVNCSSYTIVQEGQTFSCLCSSVGGNPPPVASWSKDGKVISGPGYLKTMLSLKNVSRNSSGRYNCTVRSHDLKDTRIINVAVEYKPRIISFQTDHPDDVFVNFGVPLTITCKADAFPAAKYVLLHNGTSLNGVVQGVYVISSVKSGDGGKYECRASNWIGSASKKLTLRVKDMPKAKATCSGLVVNEGEIVTCVCKSVGGNPSPNATWTRDGSDKAANGTSHLINTLVFHPIKRTDNGKYWCKVENPYFFDEIFVNIVVNYKPEYISIPPVLSLVNFGSMFNVTFIADGNPPPNLTLSHNGTILMERTERITFTFGSVGYNDSGLYECRAQNKLGEERKTSYLSVTADTKTDCSGTDKLNNENCKSYWYISVITLFCGILIGAVVTYVTPRIRHRRSRNKESVPPAEYAIPSTSTEEKRNNPVYQELNLQDMNKGDNYQALKRSTKSGRSNEAVVENEAAYQELNKVREKGDDNYQSLNRA